MIQGTHIHLKEIFPEYISPDLLNHENAFFSKYWVGYHYPKL